LDRRQQCILLRFVEAVNLVYEEDCAPAPAPVLTRASNRFAHVFDAGEDCGERDEFAVVALCEQSRERGLACARCAPEDERRKRTRAREQAPHDAPLTDELLLPDKFF